MDPDIKATLDQSIEKIKRKKFHAGLLQAQQAFSYYLNSDSIESESIRSFACSLLNILTKLIKDYLADRKVRKAKKLLKLIQASTVPYSPYFIPEKINFNNQIACAFRKAGNYSTSKKLLLRALKLNGSSATTYLNLCAIMSDLQDHKQALLYGRQARQVAQEEFINSTLEKNSPSAKNQVVTLATSYYNIGVQLEFLKKKAAKEWLIKAYEFLLKHGPEHDELLQKFRKSAFENQDRSSLQQSSNSISQKSSKSSRPSTALQRGKKTENERRFPTLRPNIPKSSRSTAGFPNTKTASSKAKDCLPYFQTSNFRTKFYRERSDSEDGIIHYDNEISSIVVPTESVEQSRSQKDSDEEMNGDLFKIIKLQANIRGFLARWRLRRERLLFRKRLIIDDESYLASFYRIIKKTELVLVSEYKTLTIELYHPDDYIELLSRVRIKDDTIVIIDKKDELIFIYKKKARISGRKCKLYCFTNTSNSKILIEAKFKQEKLEYEESCLEFSSSDGLKEHIKRTIIPGLQLVDEKLQVMKIEKKLLAKGSMYGSTIVSIYSSSGRIWIKIGDIEKDFKLKKVLKILGISDVEEFYSEPQLLMLCVILHRKRIKLRSSPALQYGHEYLCKKVLSGIMYEVKMFKVADGYFIEAIGTPPIASITLGEDRLQKIGVLDRNATDISSIVSILTVSNGGLSFNIIQTSEQKLRKAALFIQQWYRRNKRRHLLRLVFSKQQRALSSQLVARKARIIAGEPYIMTLFNQNTTMLVEAASQITGMALRKRVPLQRGLGILDTVEIHNGKIMLLSESPSKFQQPDFYLQTPEPMLVAQNWKSHSPALSHQPIAISSQQQAPKSDITNTEFPSSTESGQSTILRTSKMVGPKIYTILMKASSPVYNLKNTDQIIFEAQQGTYIGTKHQLELTVREACQCTGFPRELIIPMGYYIIRNMLIVSHEYLAFNFSYPRVRPSLYALKLQSLIRGFLTRTKMRENMDAYCKFQKKVQIGLDEWLLSIYQEVDRINIILVQKDECLSKHISGAVPKDVDNYVMRVLLPNLVVFDEHGTKRLEVQKQIALKLRRGSDFERER